jgi:hypothetical protein
MPLFRDPSPGRDAWRAFDPNALKHDTFIYDANGQLVLYRKSSSGLGTWRADMAAAIRALPP